MVSVFWLVNPDDSCEFDKELSNQELKDVITDYLGRAVRYGAKSGEEQDFFLDLLEQHRDNQYASLITFLRSEESEASKYARERYESGYGSATELKGAVSVASCRKLRERIEKQLVPLPPPA